MNRDELDQLLTSCVNLAQQAGAAIVPYWQTWQTLEVTRKSDNTPVTIADIAAHQVLLAGLRRLTPKWPILSEEDDSISFKERQNWSTYWLLDPLDGTRGFIRGSKEFTVNIALIENHIPILGVIYAPILKLCYFSHHLGPAYKQQGDDSMAQVLSNPTKKDTVPWRITIGQYHRQQSFEKKIPKNWDYIWVRLNSSLKFCLLADGGADIYIRFGPTCEWDTAAGQCILQQTGGAIVDLLGRTLRYNSKSSLLNPNFLAFANTANKNDWLNVLQ